MNPYKRLYSPDAEASVRDTITSTDAGTWVPDDESTPSDDILDAREWETVRVYLEFVGGTGTSATLTPLLAVPSDAAPGRTWLELAQISGLVPDELFEVAVEGHFTSFRVDALTLGGATSVNVKVTGGRQRQNLAGG